MTHQIPSAQKNPRFTGIKTFFRLPYRMLEEAQKEGYDVALFGVPFDGGTSYRPGTRFAPTKIRELSSLGRGYHPHYAVNFMEKIKLLDVGDSEVVPVDIIQSHKSIQAFTKEVLEGKRTQGSEARVGAETGARVGVETGAEAKTWSWSWEKTGAEATRVEVGTRAEAKTEVGARVGVEAGKGTCRFVAVGGDHSITLPLLRALHAKYNEKLALIHFDAHFDTYPMAWGNEYHHGSFLRHAIQEGLVEPTACLQIGIRGPFNAQEDELFVKEHGVLSFTTEDVKRKQLSGFSEVLQSFVKKIKSRPVHLTFDIDVLDPAYAPGTGTPVMGGLTSYEVQSLLREIKKALPSRQVVSADLVEVSPPYDPSEITAVNAVGILFEILHLFV